MRVLSHDGITMRDETTRKVLDFPEPTRVKQIQRFIGLVNFFRDHVNADHSELVRPLQAYLSQNKANRVKLSEQAKLAFFQLKEIISLQTKLFYYTEGDPIYLLTDASDYGIGGYLYQLIDNVEKPVAFISKSLTGSQLRWPTIHKEAYSTTPFVNSNIF